MGLAKTVTVDLSLKLGGVTETVDVRAEASTVDVKSAATDTNLSNDLLTLMPIYSSTSATLMNYAPGINDRSAYGSQGPYGNALLLDGVDTRDPEGGSAWTFFNQNLIQEVQIGGLGAPAEFGGFTGAIMNTVTKSGGNAYCGTLHHSLYARFARIRQHQQQRPCRKPVAWSGGGHEELDRLHRAVGRPVETGQSVLLRERPAILDELRPDWARRELHGDQSAVQREVHVPAVHE